MRGRCRLRRRGRRPRRVQEKRMGWGRTSFECGSRNRIFGLLFICALHNNRKQFSEVLKCLLCFLPRHDTTQHNATKHNTTRHDTTRHDTTQHDTTRHDTTRHDTTQHNTTQHNKKQQPSLFAPLPPSPTAPNAKGIFCKPQSRCPIGQICHADPPCAVSIFLLILFPVSVPIAQHVGRGHRPATGVKDGAGLPKRTNAGAF